MAEKTVIMDAQAIARAITRISFEIVERNRGAEDLCLILSLIHISEPTRPY